MISMTNPYFFHDIYNFFRNGEFLIHGIREHHVEKVFHVPKILFGVDNGETHRRSVCISSESGHFADEFDG